MVKVTKNVFNRKVHEDLREERKASELIKKGSQRPSEKIFANLAQALRTLRLSFNRELSNEKYF